MFFGATLSAAALTAGLDFATGDAIITKEADLVMGKRLKPEVCIEIKLSTSPQISRSFATAISDLNTLRNYIVIPAGSTFRLREDVTVINIRDFIDLLTTVQSF